MNPNEMTEEQLTAWLAKQIAAATVSASSFMDARSIFNAYVAAGIAHAKTHGVSVPEICDKLHALADAYGGDGELWDEKASGPRIIN